MIRSVRRSLPSRCSPNFCGLTRSACRIYIHIHPMHQSHTRTRLPQCASSFLSARSKLERNAVARQICQKPGFGTAAPQLPTSQNDEHHLPEARKTAKIAPLRCCDLCMKNTLKALKALRSTCGARWRGRSRRTPALRSTSAGRSRARREWNHRSTRSTCAPEGQ